MMLVIGRMRGQVRSLGRCLVGSLFVERIV